MNRNIILGMIGAAIAVAVAIVLVLQPGRGTGGDLAHVTFATDWKAQAEHGGFYQALAKGYYREAGLDVEILQGGPGVNVPQLLAAHSVDFGLGSNSFIPLNMAAADAGAKAVMASFQKDPQVFITHPRDDVKSIADMKGKPIMVSDATVSAFWQWLKSKYGFEDTQIRKYTFNLAPFLTDEKAIQQGYLSSEPYMIREQGVEPQVFLLSDYGYPGYAAFILASDRMIAERPEIVQAFVDASIKGWVDYVYGDPSPANELIKRDNPEMTDDIIANAIRLMKENGIVDSGETLTLGVGAMTNERWQKFHDEMVMAGVYDDGLSVHSAYTLEFVNQGVGLDLKKELTGE
ncbi:MAG: nitrate ABC transporter substrate-binding protein [Parvibaculum sp.]|jgi:NitT/TauT family transport system substrate-binding protein|uniref:ABC transporter substrate-binding protein n=1 Tax=Parvibaculum sp. TaxID=2024848 RepID=UPI000C668B2D|nr:ABC transporter substrate-binding protein [Parvibaculum sp.]MAU62259.1 nitrate ABC transporter substrate-binding protein [Parvibaculum sp.]HAC60129.1 nitrate ABC transporter substrate-binding protein [Rhodobiaceae bacterium]|tara:strand:- start:3060 stop:4100 length:1041 start_codon:yes stop_codon:yes gene_type:complete